MKKQYFTLIAMLFAVVIGSAGAQPNGKLQIHYINVGQGDGAILISPEGQSVMFDNGPATGCDGTLKYLASIGVTEIDYHVNSHYHLDHFGCSKKLFSKITLKTAAYDRGVAFKSDSVSSLTQPDKKGYYFRYITAIGDKRLDANPGDVITLDQSSQHPVTIKFTAVNGNSVPTINENDLSVVATVEFGKFRTEFGGDLSGENKLQYQDIETSVGPTVGRIDVYKVHHHCSRYSTNAAWLTATSPTIAIVSVGNGNGHSHPTQECLTRLRQAGVKKAYWTTKGGGAKPKAKVDVIAGHVLVEVERDATTFSVRYMKKNIDVYPIVVTN